MPEQPPHPVQVLTSVRAALYDLRRQVDTLQPAVGRGASEAINTARRELCGALVRRLEIAESEVQQLIGMLELDGKA